MSSIQPVCLNNQTYFSPCHAGCTQEAINDTIAGCGCAADQIATLGDCPNPDQEKVLPEIFQPFSYFISSATMTST